MRPERALREGPRTCQRPTTRAISYPNSRPQALRPSYALLPRLPVCGRHGSSRHRWDLAEDVLAVNQKVKVCEDLRIRGPGHWRAWRRGDRRRRRDPRPAGDAQRLKLLTPVCKSGTACRACEAKRPRAKASLGAFPTPLWPGLPGHRAAIQHLMERSAGLTTATEQHEKSSSSAHLKPRHNQAQNTRMTDPLLS